MSVPQRVLFCGTPGFAIPSLNALHEDPYFKVELVASQPDRPSGRGHKMQPSAVKAFAESKAIQVITPENISSPEVVKQIADLKLDACVVVAYGQILRKNFLDLFPQKCVNLHGSLLPCWRGAAPIQRSLMAGDKETGVSLQVVVSKLDAGAVIGERRFEVPIEMNALESHDKMSALGIDLFLNDFKSYLQGQVTTRLQDESAVTYAHKITKEEALIDWRRPASEIHNQVRGLYMGPQAYSTWNGKGVKFFRTAVSSFSGVAGEITNTEKTFFSVACGRGSLDIYELQPESGKRLSAEEFLRGFPLRRGESFGP